MDSLDFDDAGLLKTWEEVYKRGLLSFWILLLLSEQPSYPFEMNPLIEKLSGGTITADDNSLYRALRRFEEVGIVTSDLQPSSQGPARRYYRLTPQGKRLLASFIQRNLTIFQNPEIQQKMACVLQGTETEKEAHA